MNFTGMGESGSKTTDAQGRATFTGLSAGEYNVTVWWPGGLIDQRPTTPLTAWEVGYMDDEGRHFRFHLRSPAA